MRRRTALSPVSHEDQLSVAGHLDELRTRLIVSLAAVTVAFCFCFWQNHRLLDLIDAPLAHQTERHVRDGHGPLGTGYATARSARDIAIQLQTVVGLLDGQARQPALRASLLHARVSLEHDITRLSTPPQGDRPVTLGIGEPFTTTVTVSLIFALILALPVLFAQAHAFLMPAFNPVQRRSMRPLTLAIPPLFVAGVAFGYFVVLPAAVRFLQNFNSAKFNVMVQASQYYKFAATTLLAMGLLFQVPVLILAIARAGVITPRQLRRNRRYAIAACALVAAALPGDAITMLLETAPLYLLFEISVLFAGIAERRARQSSGRVAAAEG
jgi:sec-independent protein translocase protein TatC